LNSIPLAVVMMNLRIPVDRQISGLPLYVQIAEALLEQIESGKFAPGDRLPTERALSERLSVNRMTVRNALHVLEMQGLIIRRQGAGTYAIQWDGKNNAGLQVASGVYFLKLTANVFRQTRKMLLMR